MSSQNILSVFVDESGNFGDPDDSARFCIVTLVFHKQAVEISQFVKELNQADYDLGLDSESFQFHMGPLIRQEDEYAAMSRPMRGRILDRMMTFVRKVEFSYHCINVDTKYIDTPQQIFDRLKLQLTDFIQNNKNLFEKLEKVKVYYDAGQKAVSKLLVEIEIVGEITEINIDVPICTFNEAAAVNIPTSLFSIGKLSNGYYVKKIENAFEGCSRGRAWGVLMKV